jgi:hypothetical protein
MSMPMKKGSGLVWNPASVELPEIPTIAAGQDALSSTIAAVLPTLGVPLAANVATLQAKEGMFAGKLGESEASYATSDNQGGQAVGQIVGMLGQLGQQAGQMGQMAGAPAQAAGQGAGVFGSLIQQAMQGAQGGGAGGQSGGGQGAAGAAPTGGGPAAAGVAGPAAGAPSSAGGTGQPQPGGNTVDGKEEIREPQESQREEREPLQRADDSRPGPVPVTPPEQARAGGDDDIARRL